MVTSLSSLAIFYLGVRELRVEIIRCEVRRVSKIHCKHFRENTVHLHGELCSLLMARANHACKLCRARMCGLIQRNEE